ncbi:hypothetical protein T484DRAFT_1883989, partial [Baffinella frigidus]
MKRKAHELLVDLSVARPDGNAEEDLVVSLLRVVEAAEDGEALEGVMQKMARALAARILATPHTSPSLSALFQSAGVQASEPAGVRAVCAVLTAIGEVGDARAARPLWLFARQLLRSAKTQQFESVETARDGAAALQEHVRTVLRSVAERAARMPEGEALLAVALCQACQAPHSAPAPGGEDAAAFDAKGGVEADVALLAATLGLGLGAGGAGGAGRGGEGALEGLCSLALGGGCERVLTVGGGALGEHRGLVEGVWARVHADHVLFDASDAQGGRLAALGRSQAKLVSLLLPPCAAALRNARRRRVAWSAALARVAKAWLEACPSGLRECNDSRVLADLLEASVLWPATRPPAIAES